MLSGTKDRSVAVIDQEEFAQRRVSRACALISSMAVIVVLLGVSRAVLAWRLDKSLAAEQDLIEQNKATLGQQYSQGSWLGIQSMSALSVSMDDKADHYAGQVVARLHAWLASLGVIDVNVVEDAQIGIPGRYRVTFNVNAGLWLQILGVVMTSPGVSVLEHSWSGSGDAGITFQALDRSALSGIPSPHSRTRVGYLGRSTGLASEELAGQGKGTTATVALRLVDGRLVRTVQ